MRYKVPPGVWCVRVKEDMPAGEWFFTCKGAIFDEWDTLPYGSRARIGFSLPKEAAPWTELWVETRLLEELP